jgi:hypothetical protein
MPNKKIKMTLKNIGESFTLERGRSALFRSRAFCGVRIASKHTRNEFVNTTDKLYNIAKIKPYNKAEKEDIAIVSKSNMII